MPRVLAVIWREVNNASQILYPIFSTFLRPFDVRAQYAYYLTKWYLDESERVLVCLSAIISAAEEHPKHMISLEWILLL
jgi:hypothetical protein